MSGDPDSEDRGMTFGVEEEFFLIDPRTRDLLAEPDPRIFEACAANCGPHKVVPEFLRSQIETNTRVCDSVADVRAALIETRRIVANAAAEFGARVLASSTHPFAAWRSQVVTPRKRYHSIAMTLQDAVRRLIVGGMHIHLGFGDADSRVRVMTALRRHLPLMHALSASSPFSGGRATGFKSYRLNVFGSLPRTGMPGPLASWADFERLLENYRRMNFIRDSSELWWDIRPAHAYPTIEMRICDICSDLEDAVSIAALYACLARRLLRLDRQGALPPDPPTEIIVENRWLATRYGVLSFLGDAESGGRIDIDDYARNLVEELAEDARALRCEAELRRMLDVVRLGSGADRQIDHYRLRLLEGDSEQEAMHSVVDLVAAETVRALDAPKPNG